MGFGLAAAVVKEFHTAQTTALCITAANIALIMFVKVPLRSSCADLHTRGSLDAIENCMRPHALFKGSVSLIMRPTRLPRTTTHLGFLSRTATSGHAPLTRFHALSRASMRLNPLTDVIANVIHISLRCVVANVTCLTQPLTSSFDFGGLTVDFDQTVDFSRRLTFSVQVLLTQFFA